MRRRAWRYCDCREVTKSEQPIPRPPPRAVRQYPVSDLQPRLTAISAGTATSISSAIPLFFISARNAGDFASRGAW